MAGFTTRKIYHKKSLGIILKSARRKAELTLEDVENATKIRLKYLRNLESDNFKDLPAEAYNIGFVRRYAQFLGLNQDYILSLYKAGRSQSRDTNNKKLFSPIKAIDWHFLITPKLIGIIVGVVFLGSMAGYVIYQLNKFAQPPQISLTNIPNEYMTDKDTVDLVGQTSAGATVFINGELISSTADGRFNQEIKLSPGVNEITVSARSRSEKESRQLVKILYTQKDVAIAN